MDVFHLFGRIYLEHERFYSSKYESLALASETKDHPVSAFAGRSVGRIPAYDQYLQDEFGGNVDLFWRFLLQKDGTRPFLIYADTAVYQKIQFSYWKSIFADPNIETIHKLYQYYCMDAWLKSHRKIDRDANLFPHKFDHFKNKSPDEFQALYDIGEEIPALMSMDKSRVSFEYLLADSFSSTTPYRKGFLEKLRAIAWKHWFDDAESKKSELLNSFLDIRSVCPDYKADPRDFENLEKNLRSEPKLRWIVDPDFNEANIPYVIRQYPAEIFLEISENYDNLQDVRVRLGENYERKRFINHDFVNATRLLYEDKIEDLLNLDIKRGFGCMFVGDTLQDKVNQVFTNAIYQMIRAGKTQGLQGYKLK